MTSSSSSAFTGCLLLAGLLAASPSFAADEMMAHASYNPWYVEGLIGGPIPHEYDFQFLPAGAMGTYEPDPGFGFTVGAGKYFSSNMRAGVTASFAWGHDGAAVVGGVTIPHTGEIGVYTFLGNVYYEFNDFAPKITPWVGVGAGLSVFDYNGLGGPGFQYNDSDVAFTAAGHLGVDYAINDQIDLTARYTLSWTGDHSVSATTVGAVPITVDSHLENAFGIGLRFKFGG